ncbi:MAG: SDR family NAD(P)-dependent oxidoreductase [Planctomycetota bacterium]|nr:SDR family NAD(P)-dependent oxidoreductase [Planctomycetota bacterium]
MEMTGKVALVTGAAHRIGRAMAYRLADEGMHVAIHWNLSREQSRETVAACRARGVEAVSIQGDLSDPRIAAKIFAEACTLGPVQVLVNNASRFVPNRLLEIDSSQLEIDHRIHVVSPTILCREFVKQLPAGLDGRIIQMLDWRASDADPRYFSYGLAKAGSLHLMKLLAAELAPEITVNGISPGSILPPNTDLPSESTRLSSMESEENPALDQLTDALIRLIRQDDGSNGQVVPIDGWRSMS